MFNSNFEVQLKYFLDELRIFQVQTYHRTYFYKKYDERFYYIKDHLGTTRIVLDSAGVPISGYDYYPYGEVQRQYQTGASVTDRYKFTEKERDTETNYDYFGARYYDSELGRWLQVDPLVSKYPGWSPYNYVLNNPLVFIDPTGTDTLYFDAGGNYLADQTRKGEGDHIGYYTDNNGNLVEFSFNDQSDAMSILSSTTDKWIGNMDGFKIAGINIGNNSIGELFLDINTRLGKLDPIRYPLIQSQPEGLMDYAHQITGIDLSINSRATVINGIGYNNFDLGNYYWGKTMGLLGYSPALAKLAAQTFEILRNQRTDHPTDQRAIENGAQ